MTVAFDLLLLAGVTFLCLGSLPIAGTRRRADRRQALARVRRFTKGLR